MSEKIYFFDTTLRDGEQAPGINLNIKEKVSIAKQLEGLGVDCIEAGFPASSPGDLAAVAAIAEKVRSCSVAALCRAHKGDIDRAAEALQKAAKPRIHVFIATSDLHMQYKLKMDKEQVLARAVEAVQYARRFSDDVEFSAEDAGRSDREFLYRILEATIAAGATTVNIPDTVGYCTPREIFELFSNVANHVGNIDKAIMSTHCHNDLGLAVSNSLRALSGGARQIECTINGIGERAGNAALEELVMILHTRNDIYPYQVDIDATKIYRISKLVASLTGEGIPGNKPIVGANAFRHESGIHQHGVLANRETYEIMTPESIGLAVSNIVLGKHSGRHAFVQRLEELGYHLCENEINRAFERFKVLADRKKDVTDMDIDAIVGTRIADIPQVYQLESFQLQSGNKMQSTACISLMKEDTELSEVAIGDGPVDASFKAIDKIVKMPITLESYKLAAVTEGKDALGEVHVKVKYEDKVYSGKGLSTDVIEASMRAYVDAINRTLLESGLSKAHMESK